MAKSPARLAAELTVATGEITRLNGALASRDNDIITLTNERDNARGERDTALGDVTRLNNELTNRDTIVIPGLRGDVTTRDTAIVTLTTDRDQYKGRAIKAITGLVLAALVVIGLGIWSVSMWSSSSESIRITGVAEKAAEDAKADKVEVEKKLAEAETAKVEAEAATKAAERKLAEAEKAAETAKVEAKTAMDAVLEPKEKALIEAKAEIERLKQLAKAEEEPDPYQGSSGNPGETPVVSFQGWEKKVHRAGEHVEVVGEKDFQKIFAGFTPDERHQQYGVVRYVLVQLPGDSGKRFWSSDTPPPMSLPNGFARWAKEAGPKGSWMAVK